MPTDPNAAQRARELLQSRLAQMSENLEANAEAMRQAGVAFEEAAPAIARAGSMMQRAMERTNPQATERVVERITRDEATDMPRRSREATVEEVANEILANERDELRGSEVAYVSMDDLSVAPVEAVDQGPADADDDTSPNTTERQFSLIPSEPPMSNEMNVEIASIDLPEAAPQPTEDMLASVRAFGVFQSVALQHGPQLGRLSVVDGVRRVLAARAAGMAFVPALVFPSNVPASVIAGIMLTANTARRPNVLRELEAIQAMMHAGASEQTIERELRVPRAVIRQRLALARLIGGLRQALIEGRVSASIAMLASRGNSEQQIAMFEILERDGRLTARQVREILRGGPLNADEDQLDIVDEIDREQFPLGARVHEDDSISLSNGEPGWLSRAVQRMIGQARDEASAASDDAVPTELGEGRIEWEGNEYVRGDALMNARHTLPDGRRWNFFDRGHDNVGDGRVPFFILSREPRVQPVGSLEAEQGVAERFLPELWMRQQIAESRAAVEDVNENEGTLRFNAQRYVRVENVLDRERRAAEEGYERGLTVGRNSAEQQASRGANEDPAITSLAVVREETTEVTYGQAFESLTRLLNRLPVAPNEGSERAWQVVEDAISALRPFAEAEARAARPQMNLEEAVVNMGGRSIEQVAGEPNENTIMIRGPYRMFERTSDGRQFRRVLDANGRIRRRFMDESQWRQELALEVERIRRGM